MNKPHAKFMTLTFATLCIHAIGCTPSWRPSPPGIPFEESLVFQPQRFPDGEWLSKDPTFEDAWFDTPDGVRIHGWYASAPHARGVILYCHGNARNIHTRHEVLRLYRDRFQTSILMFDYRGYGKSEGSPDETGILVDARAARRWLSQRTGVAEKEIILVGNSLGGGVAVDLAARDGARGLILENTFSSLPDVATYHLPLLPAQWLMRTRLDSAAKIASYRGPLLQTHGDADRVVPLDSGMKLHKAANQPKVFVLVRGGDHNDPPTEEYLIALDGFIGSLAHLPK